MAAATSSHHLAHQGSRTTRIQIAGALYDESRLTDASQYDRLQRDLDEARRIHGHALCECRRTHLKLQIRLRDGKYHLAVWPEEGHLHDGACLFFRDESDYRGSVAAGQSAINQQGRNHPGREISLSFKLNTRHFPNGARAEGDTQSASSGELSLEMLLKLLWSEASLNRWHPKWSRDWSRVRYEALKAAAEMRNEGGALSDRIYMPRPYREAMRDQINKEWDWFVGSLGRTTDGVAKSGLLIAPVRKFNELPSGQMTMQLSHMNVPIGISDGVYEFLHKQCRNSLRRVDTNEGARDVATDRPEGWVQLRYPEVIAIVVVEPNSRQGMWARAAWLMQVHPKTFIPAVSTDEVALIDALVNQGYQFSRVLAKDSDAQQGPNWIVRHVIDPNLKVVARAALEIMNKGAPPDFRNRRGDVADQLAREGIPTWTWTPVGSRVKYSVPPLPPMESDNAHQLRKQMEELQRSAHLTYVYGSNR